MTILELLEETPIDDILCVSDVFDWNFECGVPRRDSRCVGTGDVFFCIRGRDFDGHDAIADAVVRGAAYVVLSEMHHAEHCPIPWICVRDTAAAFLPACLAYFGHPERGMKFFAVTGTNGKTSITYLLEHIFSQHVDFSPCAVFGTVENRIAGIPSAAANTTPAPELLAELLCQARGAGVKTVILEASSHALAQKRLSGLRFVCGIFTNLTEDHLDYHKSMEDYFLCKRTLFFSCDRCLVNTDDAWGRRLAADPAFAERMTTYSPSNAAHFPIALPKTCCDFITANQMAAAACAHLAGMDWNVICEAFRSLPQIPGRMERIVETPFSVYLDYAHTPDALSRAISGLRQRHPKQRILVLFGCGGDREREKRPKMGAIAAYQSDLCIVTSDNSRSEDPMTIIDDILAGIPSCRRSHVKVIPNRKCAIETLLSLALPGDILLLAGKGHEAYQTDQTGTHPFSEREIIANYMNTRT